MTISNFKSIGKGSLVGAFDLETTQGFMFHGVLLFTGQNGMWPKLPEIPQYKDNQPVLKDGKQVYKWVVSIPDRERRDKFNAMVIDALKAGGHV